MSAQGVFTPDIRVAFVDGQESATPDPGFVACGDGKAFPMQITLDQLAEILFRVKDAWFTGGGISFLVFGTPVSYPAPTSAPANRTLYIDATTYQTRGYSKPGADDYNGELYGAGIGVDYSDISTNERGVWRDAWRSSHKDAFSYDADDPNNLQGGSKGWWGLANAGARVQSIRGNRVAVVKTDPTNGFYDPTNKYFLEFEFYWFDWNPFLNFGGGTNIYNGSSANGPSGDWSADAAVVCNYVIRLQSGDVTCPIYFPASNNPTGGSDVIHAAQEWWPYDRNVEPRQLWDAATGEFVPIGAPVLAFDLDFSEYYLTTF